jgi:hypothetical protein
MSTGARWGIILAVLISVAAWVGLYLWIGWWSLLVLGAGAVVLGVIALRD